MASRVNVKFVVILVALLVVFSAVIGVVGFMLVFKSGEDHIRIGDIAMAEGRYEDARISYGKAVNDDMTRIDWIEKMISAIEAETPATEASYRSLFQRDYFSAISTLASQQRTDIPAQERFLGLLHAQLANGFSRALADQMVEQTTKTVSWFESANPADDSWKRLLRYRGLPMEMVVGSKAVLDDDVVEQVREDLAAAYVVSPGDSEVACALARWHAHKGSEARRADHRDKAQTKYDESIAVLDGFLARNPDDPSAILHHGLISYDQTVAAESAGKRVDDARRIARERLVDMGPNVRRAVDALLVADPGSVSMSTLRRLRSMEASAMPESGSTLTRQVIARLLETRGDDDGLLLLAAEIEESAGNKGEAVALLEQSAALPDLPISLKGWMRFHFRRQALVRHALIELQQALGSKDEVERAAALESGRVVRGKYAAQVSEDDTMLLLIDGLQSQVEERYRDALSLYQRYNEQTLNRDARGLWRQGQVAMMLRQHGLAETSFQRLIEAQPNNISAMLALGEVSVVLRKEDAAMSFYQQVLASDPGNQFAAERLAALSQMVDPTLAEDPVTQVLLEARQISRGDAENPPDLVAASAYLAGAVETHDFDPRMVTELVSYMLETGDVAGARLLVKAAAERHPDDEVIGRFERALTGETVGETLISLIEESEREPLDKTLAKYAIYSDNEMPDKALEMLAAASQIAADDPRVIELRFIEALRQEDWALGRQIAAQATELDADQSGGLTFQARLEASQGNFSASTKLLEQAIAQGGVSPMVHRMLAGMRSQSGDRAGAIEALETALELQPNEVETINEYIALLASSGKTAEALDAARRSEPYGRSNARFNSMWLSLEAQFGGEEGMARAVAHRERLLIASPEDQQNKAALATLYIEQGRWDESKTLIDELRAGGDSLGLVMLAGRWYADQGRVLVDGKVVDGMEEARRVFANYLITLDEDEIPENAYLLLARFMLARNKHQEAIRAIQQAQLRQDPKTRDADKMLADLFMTRLQYEQAAQIYRTIVEGGADDERQTYRQRLIESMLRLGQYEPAKEQIAQLSDQVSQSVTVMLQQAEVERALGQRERAMELHDEAVARHPKEPLVYTKRAQMMLGRPELMPDVMADLETALRINPNDWRTLRLRASIYHTAGRKEEAIKDFRAAIKANPSMDEVIFGLIHELINNRKFDQAVSVAEEVIDARSFDIGLMINLARTFGNAGDWRHASDFMGRAWTKSQDLSVGSLYIDSLVSQKPARVQEAMAVLERMREFLPEADKTAGFLQTEAIVLNAAGKPNSTRRKLLAALDASVGHSGTMSNWINTISRMHLDDTPAQLILLSDIRQAVQDGSAQAAWLNYYIGTRLIPAEPTRQEGVELLRALRNGPDEHLLTRMAYLAEGDELHKAGQFEQAREAWEAGIARFPDFWQAGNNLAYMLSKEMNDCAGALPMAEMAVRAAPEVSELHDTLATVYLCLDRLDEARTTLLEAERLARTTRARVNVLLNKTRLQIKLSHFDRARAALIQAQSMTAGSGTLGDLNEDVVELLAELDTLQAGGP